MDSRIEKVFKDYNFIVANKRAWYPFRWPGDDWFERVNPESVKLFIEKVRQLCIDDLFFFADNVLRSKTHPHLHIGLHDEMCHLLQYGGDVGILIPRNHLKSTLASGAFPLWLLGKNQNLRIMICSSVGDLAEALITYLSDQITSNKRLMMVFPELIPARNVIGSVRVKMWNKQALQIARTTVLKEPSLFSMGLDNQPKTGFHCDIMLYDDIVTPDNAGDPERLKKVKLNYEHSLNLLDMNSRTIFVGTRYHDSDVYGNLIKSGDKPFYIRQSTEDGKYCWPYEPNIKRVEKMRKELPAHIFAAQYQNDPIVAGDAEFDPKWVQRWEHEELLAKKGVNTSDSTEDIFWDWVKTLDIHMGCDPARTDKKKSDFTVIMVVGVDVEGHVYCLEVMRKKLRTEDIVEEFIKTFQKWSPKTAKVETCGGDIHVFNILQKKMKERLLPYMRVSEYETSRKMSGEDRIRELQYPMSQKMIFFGPGEEWDEIIFDELLRFPYGSHDDGITTLAYINSQQAKPKKERKVKPVLGAWQSRRRVIRERSRSWLLQ